MNTPLLWYRRLAWTGIAINIAFALPSLFFPDLLATLLDAPTLIFSYVWVADAGMLLLQASLFYVPAACRPERYHVFAWIGACCRLVASVFWFWQAQRWQLTGPMSALFVSEAVIGLLSAVLLQLGLPDPYRLSGDNVIRSWRAVRTAIAFGIRSRAVRIGGIIALVWMAAFGYGLWINLGRALADTEFSTPEDQFKYGAIGLATKARIPLYLWEVMPDVCPDLLPGPGGWASFGLIIEPNHTLPIGFAQREIGFPSVEPNCALCHTSSYRTTPTAERMVLLGAPAHELNLQAFQWFLYDCAGDARFTPTAVLAKIRERHQLSWFQAAVYRFIILPFAKSSLAGQAQDYAWQKTRPLQGRGRTDTFNPTKINVFHLPDDGSIGTVDLPAIWNQRARVGLWLHWDGNNNQIQQRNYAAAMAIGATPTSVLPSHFQQVTNFVLDVPAPAYPFPIDEAKAAQGAGLFQTYCASCHALGGPGVGTVTPIAEIATDRHRLDSFTEGLVERFHSIQEPPFVFSAYRKTDGYTNLPIDAPWARAPYLHNGSVPTLWDLLQPAALRARTFWRGSNVFDPIRVGFVTTPGDGNDFLLDTTLPGNGNQGHEYGTALTDDQKWALIEFLKKM